MKRRQRLAWLQDVRLAARWGQAEALDAALDGLRAEPAIRANRRLSPEMVHQALVPAGRALAVASVPASYLRALARSPYAAYRAVAAAAWAQRYAQGRASLAVLEPLAKDPREEVRAALLAVLRTAPQKARQALVRTWLTPGPRPRSPRLIALAWDLAPDALPPAEVWERALVWAARDEAGDLAPALASALQAAARQDPALAWERLEQAWAMALLPPPLLARVLGGAWAARRPDAALRLLRELYWRYGRRRWLTQALQALQRHADLADVEALLRTWETERP